uniref:Guanylate cyclase n=1 Tax=Panagrellus redivivus TaxID=6233 RepID=A0A7E4VF23_PANRE
MRHKGIETVAELANHDITFIHLFIDNVTDLVTAREDEHRSETAVAAEFGVSVHTVAEHHGAFRAEVPTIWTTMSSSTLVSGSVSINDGTSVNLGIKILTHGACPERIGIAPITVLKAVFLILTSVLPPAGIASAAAAITPIANMTGYPPIQLRIGVLLPTNESTNCAFDNSASALAIATDQIYADGLLPPGSNISFYWRPEECVEATSAGYTFEFITQQNIDMVMAPPCIDGAVMASHVATYYNIPVGLWGTTFAAALTDPVLFPSTLSTVPSYSDLAEILCAVMQVYNWKKFSYIYQTDPNGGCRDFTTALETVINAQNFCVTTYKGLVDDWSAEAIAYMLDQIKQTSRIVILCFDDDDMLRSFGLELYNAKLLNNDYVYLIPDIDLSNSAVVSKATLPFWFDKNTPKDGLDKEASELGKYSFQISIALRLSSADTYSIFMNNVMTRMKDWPFYCDTCNRGQAASPYAVFLHDTMYLYGLAMNALIDATKSTDRNTLRNGAQIADNSNNVQFSGMSGTVSMVEGIRASMYALANYTTVNDGSMTEYALFQISTRQINSSLLYTDAATSIWYGRGGVQPVDEPECGFDGNGCPMNVFDSYKGWFIAAICVVVAIVVLTVSGLSYSIHMRMKEVEAQNKMWQVTFSNLVKMNPKKMAESFRSLQSGPSTTSTKFTFDSVKTSKHFNMYMYFQERVVGYKHHSRLGLGKEEMTEYRLMRSLDHENVNRFIGVCLDSPEPMSIWRFCSRGSLRDIIATNTYNMDAFFIFSLIKDIVEGLFFMHNCFLGCHGFMKSSYCLVDDRWQVKLSNYGLSNFRNIEPRTARDQLWTAPELIRENDHIGTKAGDVYSFAIICSEIINMKPVWEPSETKGNPEEIVYLVKKGGIRPLRPVLQPTVPDINPAMLHLIRDCWSDNPNDRPKIEMIRSLLKNMVTGKNNLMDHVFNMLEQYAGSLEEEVEERTKELVEEKKKSDLLLYRMLPKQVAEKLKLGQSVEPESFECVTVFFSDVVSFTTLASRCTPLQVVNLLNDLYTLLDGIIAEHDVYKVETIGDGYLCVSGLPHRNGNEHARHVALMALAIMRSLGNFSISHLPGERIRMRIGLHSGPCVAGVVGLAMPRYCLFGDTVNTASRMESNGKPNKIHLSADANYYVTKVVGGFITESRGEVIIKGKGVMETYWLLGQTNEMEAPLASTPPPPPLPPAIKQPDTPPPIMLNATVPMYEDFKNTQM